MRIPTTPFSVHFRSCLWQLSAGSWSSMKTCGTDTVLYKLRVSSFSPSPDSSPGPEISGKYRQKTTVYNGVSANSWLLPIGICERDTNAENVPESTRPGPKSRNSRMAPSTKDSAEARSACSKTAGYAETKEAAEEGPSHRHDSIGQGGKDVILETAQSTTSSRPLTSEEFDSLWARVSHRPQHTGNVFIIRRRNLPQGIDKNEYLQGKHLRSKFEADETADGEKDIQLQPRPFTAPGRREGSACYLRPPRPFSHTGVSRVRDLHNCPPVKTQQLNCSLDLVITSLHCPAHDSSAASVHGEASARDTPARTSGSLCSARPKTASASTGKGRHHGDPLSTIDGIKRDYQRRAKSAPPNGRSQDLSPSLQDVSTPSCRGPSLYWRARSTYHKKLLTYGPDEGPDPNEQSQNIRGSLWRPLLVGEDSSVMQHSAGCPYTCKGCFKACLVSQDYLHKARAQKALREKKELALRQTGHFAPQCRPSSVPHRYKVKVNHPKNLVSVALAKSQPLYQLVHGNRSVEHRHPGPSGHQEHADSARPRLKDDQVSVTDKNQSPPDNAA